MKKLITASPEDTLSTVFHTMKENGLSQIPVGSEIDIIGSITEKIILENYFLRQVRQHLLGTEGMDFRILHSFSL